MRIALIAALSDNGVIGKNNQLPWRLPADMQHFKRTTMGKPIIMGRKTFASFGAKPLPGRHNIVLTRDTSYRAVGATVVSNWESALTAAGSVDEVMVIGGADLYAQTLPYADRLYLTRVHGEFEGDAFFPEISANAWEEVSRVDLAADDKNTFPCSMVELQRRYEAGDANSSARKSTL